MPGRRAEVLRLLTAAPEPVGVAAIAGRLRAHPNTVRFHLDALVRSGHAERVAGHEARPGRPPLLFRALPGPQAAGPRDYRLLADMLLADIVAGVDPVTVAKQAGRRWGRRIVEPTQDAATPAAAKRLLVRELDRVGFAPHTVHADRTVDLGNCPFLEAVHAHGRVVCDLHLGFVEGVLNRLGAQISAVELIPFAEAGRCRLVLSAPGHGLPAAR